MTACHVAPLTLIGRQRETATLRRLLDDVHKGNSAVLVLRGESGVGKTALLHHLVGQASGLHVAHIAGAESEMELAYAGLHQLCGPLLDDLDKLPAPQRDALRVALGLQDGSTPDRFLVGLAALGLLAEFSVRQPLLCVVDDAQWLDRASLQALSFVARRVVAEPIAMTFAVRAPGGECELAGLPELVIPGLDDRGARALLAMTMPGCLDERVRERILAEARGNPLALLELHTDLTPADVAGGYGLAEARPLTHRIESSFATQLRELPSPTRQLLLIAAADPVGSAALLLRAAERLGLGVDDAAPAEAAGLMTIGTAVHFRHPLVRSAIYRTAPLADRRRVHQALADATDSRYDVELRAWHRAQAAPDADESVADELACRAEQARARGGVAAAAAFLTRATYLTPDPVDRVRRALDAARAKLDAGAPDAALDLVAIAEAGPSDDLQLAHCELLRARIAFTLRGDGDSPLLFLAAAERLTPLDEPLARETYLEALMASIFVDQPSDGDGADPHSVARAAKAAPLAPQPARGVDLLLDGLIARFGDGYVAAAPLLKAAMSQLHREYSRCEGDPRWYGLAGRVALDLWDQHAWDDLTARQLTALRAGGRLTLLPGTLAFRIATCVHAGRFSEAQALLEEANAIAGATGTSPPGYIEPLLAAYRGDEARTLELVRAGLEEHAGVRAERPLVMIVHFAAAVLHISLGQYLDALAATDLAIGYDELDMYGYALAQRIEAAARLGETDIAAEALQQLVERAEASGTDLALGVAARSRALLADGAEADALYREAITLLRRSRVNVLLARAQLIYGEWLRSENRRDEAREQLRRAYEVFTRVGADGFAERTRLELLALGESVGRTTPSLSDALTNQELFIARLARDGHTNQEIAAQLFISRRTVEWHLSKIFHKLDIKSRRALRAGLAQID